MLDNKGLLQFVATDLAGCLICSQLTQRDAGVARGTRARLAKTARQIVTVRCNRYHRTSRQIANTVGTIVIKDLQTSRMTWSAKGTARKHAPAGRPVRPGPGWCERGPGGQRRR